MNLGKKMGVGNPFLLLVSGQTVSMLGSALTGFGLSIWVVQHTDSITQYTISIVFLTLPGAIALPFMGGVIDRFDRRLLVALADTLAAVCTLLMAVMLYLDQLAITHIYAVNVVFSLCMAIQGTVYMTLVRMLVPDKNLGRANGMMEFGDALSEILAPVLAGALLVTIGLVGIMMIDLTTFLFGMCALLMVRMPKLADVLKNEHFEEEEVTTTTIANIRVVISFLRKRPVLAALFLYFGFTDLMSMLAGVFVVPLVLAMYSEFVLGTLMSLSAIGTLLGAVMMMLWQPKRFISVIVICNVLLGLSLVVVGANSSLPIIISCGVIVFFLITAISTCQQTIWQRFVPMNMHGRFFALQGSIQMAAMPVAAVAGGLMIDNLFEPWMMAGGLLAQSVGSYIGTGEGRGIGLVFILAGLMSISATVVLIFMLRRNREAGSETKLLAGELRINNSIEQKSTS